MHKACLFCRSILASSLFLATLASCTTTSFRSEDRIDEDFFAVVADIQVLDTDLATINKAMDMGVDNAVGQEIEEQQRKREGYGDVGSDNDGANFFIGAMVGAIIGLGEDLQKSHFKYHYNLRDMDGEVVPFYGDTKLALGDCVYVDVQKGRRGKEWVEIAKVADKVCVGGA